MSFKVGDMVYLRTSTGDTLVSSVKKVTKTQAIVEFRGNDKRFNINSGKSVPRTCYRPSFIKLMTPQVMAEISVKTLICEIKDRISKIEILGWERTGNGQLQEAKNILDKILVGG